MLMLLFNLCPWRILWLPICTCCWQASWSCLRKISSSSNIIRHHLRITNLVKSWFLNFSSFSSLHSWACGNITLIIMTCTQPLPELTLDFWVDGQMTGWERICTAEGLSEGLAWIVHWWEIKMYIYHIITTLWLSLRAYRPPRGRGHVTRHLRVPAAVD